MYLIKLLVILNINLCFSDETTQESQLLNPTPIVFWNGMGGNCHYISIYLDPYFVEYYPNGIHIHCLRIGNSPTEESENSLTMDINKQIDMACHLIGNDTLLKNG